MRHPIQNAHAGIHGEYMAQDEAACYERSGRQEPPTRRKAKAKAKAKTQLRKNILGAPACLPTRTGLTASEVPKNPKSKNKS
jgi:hypothetical protein